MIKIMPSFVNPTDRTSQNYLAFTIAGLSGYNLKRGVFFNPDPYVKLRVLPGPNCNKLPHHKQRFMTKQVRGTTNPTWKEQFFIQVIRSDIIELEVKDKFDGGRPVIRGFLGKLDISVSEMLERLQCSEQRYTGALTKRSPLDQTSGSLSFVIGDGRSSLYGGLSFPNNGNNYLQRVSIASNESSYTELQSLDPNSSGDNLSSALTACLNDENDKDSTSQLVILQTGDGSDRVDDVGASDSRITISCEKIESTAVEASESIGSTASHSQNENDSPEQVSCNLGAIASPTTPSMETLNESASITVDYSPSDDTGESLDDVITITTTFDQPATSQDDVLPMKETNLDVTADASPSYSAHASVDVSATPQPIPTHTPQSRNVRLSTSSSPRNVPERGLGVTIEAEQTSSSFPILVKSTVSSPQRANVAPKKVRDREALRNLLQYVARIERAKLNNSDAYTKEYLMELEMVIHRPDVTSHLGFNIVGGTESKHLVLRKMGIYVTRVEPFSPADLAGIKIYDRLLKVNNISVVKVPHSVVVDTLRTAGRDVSIKVEREKPIAANLVQKTFPSHPSLSLGQRRSSLPTALSGSPVTESAPSTSNSQPADEGAALAQGKRLADSAKRRHRLTSRDLSGTHEELSQDGLPANWEACRDRYGRVFYLDHTNRRTQWQRPHAAAEESSGSDTSLTMSDEILLRALSDSTKPVVPLSRYSSVKRDRHFERVMRRYQSVRRVMRHDQVIEEAEAENERNSQSDEPVATAQPPGIASTSSAATAPSAPVNNEQAASSTTPSSGTTSDGTSESNRKVTSRDPEAVQSATAQESDPSVALERENILEKTPGFRFISHPEFVMMISTNEEAYNQYMNSSSVRYMITKIHRDKNNFFEYQHNKELVKFVNSFRDSSKPLPQGWEMNTDSKGSEFFVDHNLRRTTFFDPRLPFQDDPSPTSSNNATNDASESSEQNETIAEAVEQDRLPVQSPLSQTPSVATPSSSNPSVAPRPNSTLSPRSRAVEVEPPALSVPTVADPRALELDSLPVSYNEKVVAFLKQPNILDILKERYPDASRSQSLKDKVNSIRSEGLSALERYVNSVQLTIVLSLFENEIMSFVVKQERVGSANVLAHRRTLAPETVRPRSGSPATTPANTRTRVSSANPVARNFKSKLGAFYRKLEQKGYGQGPSKIKLHLHRENLLEEAYRKVMTLQRKELQRSKLFISFIGEEGLDYSGPSREFFFLISREIFNPYYGLFEYSAVDTYTVQISPLSSFVENSSEWFRFAGRIIGLSLIHHCLLDAFFTRPLYKMLLRSTYDLSDLRYVDEQFYQSMTWMKENNITDVLELTFSVDEELFGKIEEKELKPNGKNIAVTEKNKKEYIEKMVKWRVCRGTNEQINNLIRGFNEVVDLRLLSSFDAHELELVLCGTADIDLNDWRANTEYRGGYYDLHPVIQWFWMAVEQFDNEQRLRLLQFVTGTSSIPYEGFAALRGPNGPKRFCIEKWGKEDALPRAHTCFNRIDLPPYHSFALLWEKLLIAVEETSTFGME